MRRSIIANPVVDPAPSGRWTLRSAGWIGFGIIAMLILGLVVAGNLGNEFLAWMFGVALMVAIPAMFFVSIGSAIGRLFLRSRTTEEKTK